MGLRDRLRGDAGPAPRRYQMREKLLSIGDDYWIEDDGRVDARSRSTARPSGSATRSCCGTSGAGRSPRSRSACCECATRWRLNATAATPPSARRSWGCGTVSRSTSTADRTSALTATCVDHEYEIERDGDTVATVSKKWFRVRDTYGVEIEPDQDDALVLAITVCIDAMTHD